MFAKLNNFVLYGGRNNAVSHGLEFKRDAVPGKRVFRVSRWIPDLGMEFLSVVGDGFNNYQGIPTLENAAYEFITDTWGKILVVSLEFAPRQSLITWSISEKDLQKTAT